jgi:hypothetical protein
MFAMVTANVRQLLMAKKPLASVREDSLVLTATGTALAVGKRKERLLAAGMANANCRMVKLVVNARLVISVKAAARHAPSIRVSPVVVKAHAI